MSMNKAEKAEMEALRVRCALAWPPIPPKPIDLDVARAGAGVEYLHLWWVNDRSGLVGVGVTNGHHHSTRDHTDTAMANRYRGGSHVSLAQGAGGPWFASEVDALQALHHAVALDCAKRLAGIAARVEAAQ